MIQEQGEHQQELQEKEIRDGTKEADGGPGLGERTGLPRPCVLCLPAHDEGDEIAAMMLAQIVEPRGCLVETASAAATVSELIDLVGQRKADLVCISATPPAPVAHARHLCIRLRRRYPEMNLVVGLWDASGDLSKAKERIGGGATTQVVATLADAQEQIRLLLQPLPRSSEKQAQPGGS
jgi:methylmalonyl-CoA mutase cobalamin-binding subunit